MNMSVLLSYHQDSVLSALAATAPASIHLNNKQLPPQQLAPAGGNELLLGEQVRTTAIIENQQLLAPPAGQLSQDRLVDDCISKYKYRLRKW